MHRKKPVPHVEGKLWSLVGLIPLAVVLYWGGLFLPTASGSEAWTIVAVLVSYTALLLWFWSVYRLLHIAAWKRDRMIADELSGSNDTGEIFPAGWTDIGHTEEGFTHVTVGTDKVYVARLSEALSTSVDTPISPETAEFWRKVSEARKRVLDNVEGTITGSLYAPDRPYTTREEKAEYFSKAFGVPIIEQQVDNLRVWPPEAGSQAAKELTEYANRVGKFHSDLAETKQVEQGILAPLASPLVAKPLRVVEEPELFTHPALYGGRHERTEVHQADHFYAGSDDRAEQPQSFFTGVADAFPKTDD